MRIFADNAPVKSFHQYFREAKIQV